MESRKAWRNRDRSAGEGVLALLEGLRNGLGADAVGLFDDDRADAAPTADAGALDFWDAFDPKPCASIDWRAWYRELKTNQRVDVTCGCGAGHRLCGFLIHGRWALLLIAPPTLPEVGAVAIASSLRALADRLPPARTAEERRQIARYEDGGADEAKTETRTEKAAAPVWWVRKLPQ